MWKQFLLDAFRLDGKIALVTGGASGIGAATCRELTRAGAHVLIADLNLPAAQSLAAELPNANAVEMDVTDAASIARAFSAIPTSISSSTTPASASSATSLTPPKKTSPASCASTSTPSSSSPRPPSRCSSPPTAPSSTSAPSPVSVGVKQRFAYCASKGAVHAMTRQIAVDYPKELRINCIAPGTVQTPFVEGYLDKYHAHEKEKVRAELVARQPIGRLGTPEDIAALVRYLCSREAEFINGAIIPIDGGWTAA